MTIKCSNVHIERLSKILKEDFHSLLTNGRIRYIHICQSGQICPDFFTVKIEESLKAMILILCCNVNQQVSQEAVNSQTVCETLLINIIIH